MKTYTLSDNAIRNITNATETISYMLDSEQEFTIEAVNAQFDKIDNVISKNYSNEVLDKVTNAIEKAVKIPFPNFDISKYTIDLNNDQIKRGDGTLVNKSNATTVEKTILAAYQGMVDESNEVDNEVHEIVDSLRSRVFGM
jgi:hypothetical protein